MSISPDDEIHYAALLGPGHTRGTEPFFGEVPESILDLIGRVAPVDGNPNHVNVCGWPVNDKPAQMLIAKEIAAVAKFAEAPGK